MLFPKLISIIFKFLQYYELNSLIIIYLFLVILFLVKKQNQTENKRERSRALTSSCFNRIADDKSHTGAANSSSRIGEGAGTLQRLLQQVHYVSEGQDAERKSATKRLQSSWPRYGSVQRQQRQQSVTG